MPTFSHQKSSSTHGSAIGAVVVGQSLAGTIDVTTTKNILLTYHVTDGTATTTQGADATQCFDVVTQSHTLTWTATVDIREVITKASVVQIQVGGLAADAEKAGFGTMILGGAIAVGGVVTGPGESLAAPVGAGLALIGGLVNRLGKAVKEALVSTPEIHTRREDKSGSCAFTSVTRTPIECLPGHTYAAAPAEATADKGEHDCLTGILAGI
jgi:hypothetical protein